MATFPACGAAHSISIVANLPVIGGFAALPEGQSGHEHSINVYPQKSEGKTEFRLRNTPGLKPFAVIGTGKLRGAVEINGRAFVIEGRNCWEVFYNGVFVLRGVLNDDLSTPVRMDTNGLQVGMTDGLSAYVITLSDSSFVRVTSLDWYPSRTIAVVDGFAVFCRDGTGQYFHSDLYNMLVYIPSDFASAETNPDNLAGMANDPVGLIGLGNHSIETYYNSGDSEQVFQRRPGAKINLGCIAPYSIVTTDNSTIWLGADGDGVGGVYRLIGGSPQKISTIAIDEALKGKDLANAEAFSYRQAGGNFYLLNVPDLDTTLVYDTATRVWCERRSFDGDVWGRWWGNCHFSAFGKNFAGDYRTGALYELDLDYFFDGGSQIIRRERILKIIFDDVDYDLVSFSGLELDMSTGVGLTNPPYDNPQLTLQVSRDGGQTWGVEHYTSVGRAGEFIKRVKYRRLGISNNTTFKLVYTYPTVFIINQVFVSAAK